MTKRINMKLLKKQIFIVFKSNQKIYFKIALGSLEKEFQGLNNDLEFFKHENFELKLKLKKYETSIKNLKFEIQSCIVIFIIHRLSFYLINS